MRISTQFALIVFVAITNLSATFGGVQGRVVHNNKGIAGAMVTFFNSTETEDPIYFVTVYTDVHGNFDFGANPLKLKDGHLRVRHPLFRDTTQALVDGNQKLGLEPFSSEKELSDSLPASAHLVRVLSNMPSNKVGLQTELISQCMMCHQLGNSLTRAERPVDVWEAIIKRMEGMGALLTWDGRAHFPKVLHRSFQESQLADLPDAHLKLEPLKARIQEWTLAEGTSHVHDVIIAQNGKIYGVDMSLDRVYALDTKTGAIAQFNFPESELPLGGVFEGAYHPVGTFDAKFGPHSIQQAPNGIFWITASLANEIMSFNGDTGEFKRYPMPSGVYPHTMRFDREGNVWFTISVTNQIAKLNPVTGEFTTIQLPSDGFFQWISTRLAKPVLKIAALFPRKNFHVALGAHNLTGSGFKVLPIPYGVDIHPKDGGIWYSKLNGDRIGRVDPHTLEVKEYDTPRKGPRRMRFSADGMLWIPSFIEGYLLRFDPETEQFTSYEIPPLGPNQRETPYALAVHPKTQEVWITGGASDRLVRFNPQSKMFTMYPLPTRVTFMRDIDFTEEGAVCSSYANLPGYAIEGGRPKVVCLSPL